MGAKEKEDKTDEKVGGFAFYLSLLVLIPLGLLVILISFSTWNLSCAQSTAVFLVGCLVGFVVGHSMIRGKLSVFLHEFKHSLISNLVGNKAKGMKIDTNSGHFEYKYSKATSHYNAFISLAPYIVPIATIISVPIAIAFFRSDHRLMVLVVGIGYGIDILLNIRDISPIQTDITGIRGGYKIGLTYILAWNLVIFGFLASWVFHGISGPKLMLTEFTDLMFMTHKAIKSDLTPE